MKNVKRRQSAGCGFARPFFRERHDACGTLFLRQLAHCLVSVTVLGGVPVFATAQTAATIAPLSPAQAVEEALRRQEDRARELQQQTQTKSDVLKPQAPVTLSATLPKETPCFVITDIQLTGRDAARFGWLGDASLPYLGQCAGVGGVRRIADALDAKLIELGYVTSRVTLPQQNLKDGVLTFQLHIGRVADIGMLKAGKGQPADDAWGTWRNAFPVSAGDVLNVRDLEQGIEQMKRLPSQMVATELEPGAEPDTSNVRILRQTGSLADRIRGGVTLDNSGGEALGRAQLSSYVSLDNPLGLNDLFSASVSSNAENPDSEHRSQSASFNYSIPWGYNTFTFSKSNSRFAQIVQGTTAHFLSSGHSESADVRWHRTMLRTSSAKTGLYAALGTRRANSFLDDVELIVQRRRTTSFETGITYKQLVGNASLEFELGYRRGMPWQNAQDDLSTAASGGLTTRPTLTTVSAAFSLPFKLGGRSILHTTNIRAQYTRDMTLSVDQFAIGSQYTVRGFDGDGVLLAESGYFVRNEWSTPMHLLDGVDSAAFIGLDFGRVWGPSVATLVGDKLAGAAFGLRGSWKGLQFDLALGTPLYRPDGFRTKRWNPYLSLTYAF